MSSQEINGRLRNVLSQIANFANMYRRKYLSEDGLKEHDIASISSIRDDWFDALKFFFSRVLYQGRRDKISREVEKRVVDVLKNFFGDPKHRDKRFRDLKCKNWRQVREKLKDKIGRGKIGRERDIDLVIDTLEFISRIPKKNIVEYAIQRIKRGELESLWRGLQRSKSELGIRSVGEKTAALFLRDLVVLFNLEEFVDDSKMIYLQPIDTWVKKICHRLAEEGLGLAGEGLKLARSIVKLCQSTGVSPIDFNMGAWILGTHALEILMEKIITSGTV